jgi:outer membrane protein OmpA-like peptidoglycan-associated protein
MTLTAIAFLLAACSQNQPPASQATSMPPRFDEQARSAEQATTDRDQSAGEDAFAVVIATEIQRECALPKGAEDVPRFAFDEAQLRPRGRNILDDVKECLTAGRLRDRTITIIGRADPRGPDQYNQELGLSRAEAARQYLVRQGVPERQLVVKSRGESGAQGTDETSWSLDRRVDLVLDDAATDGTMTPASGQGEQRPSPE